MDNFEFAHKFTAKWEGGYVNNPKDPGGATNYGVSLRWLKNEGIDIDNDGSITIEDVKKLTPDKASELFYTEFWLKLHCDKLPKLIATATYDAGVNVGRTQAGKFLQRACNTANGTDILVVDGIIGPKTVKYVNSIVPKPIADFVLACYCIGGRTRFYQELGNNSPYADGRDYRSFMSGWLNRTVALIDYVKGA